MDDRNHKRNASQFQDSDKFDPVSKCARLSKHQLHKPPSAEELRTLKETENLFHSNLFRLQIEELLLEVKMKEKYRTALDKWLDEFKQAVEDIPDSDQYTLTDQKWLKKLKVKPPIIQDPYKLKGKFRFVKPSCISFTGSYTTGLEMQPDTVIDVKLEIPKICFQKLDNLNQRYHRKRALYLSYLAAHLKQTNLVEDMWFSYHHGDEMKPVLLLKPSGKLGKYVTVQLLPVMPSDIFQLQRFSPNRNNVRSQWFTGKPTEVGTVELPTPHYNSSIVADLVMDVNGQYRQQMIGSSQNVKDGVILLNVWLRQRGLDRGYGSFSSFIMSMYIVYLLAARRISRLMSSYQIVRSTMTSLAQSDWSSNGISLAQDAENQPSLGEFHSHFEVVFVDPSGFGNLCANMTQAVYYQTKREAEMAMKFLQDTSVNSFSALFMTPVPFLRTFDQLICLQNMAELQKVAEEKAPRGAVLDHCGLTLPVVTPMILRVLNRGLQRRVQLVTVESPCSPQWSVNEKPPGYKQLRIGLILNQETFSGVLEKGPSADHRDAREFKEFWGDKSELRRFQDTSICEAVLWPGKNVGEKRAVCVHIVKYILKTHFNIHEENVHCVVNQLDTLLKLPSEQKETEYGTGEEAAGRVLEVYMTLVRQLKDCDEFPLEITSMQGISPVFRCADVFPPLPILETQEHGSIYPKENHWLLKVKADVPPHWVPPLEVLVHLERSGKWPEAIEAIRRLKAAFHIRLSEVLEHKFSLPTVVHQKYVDVLKDGYVFRLRVVCSKEVSVMKMTQTDSGMLQLRDTPESLALKMETVALANLTGALYGLQQQYPSFSSACRLAKRWVSAQLMSSFIHEHSIELLVACLYIHAAPFTIPSQPQVAFIRFLNLLSTTDWKIVPLVVNLNNELTNADILEIENSFQASRSTLPALFIASPFDRTSYWTTDAPTTQLLIRLTRLAAEALRVLESDVLCWPDTDPKVIFRPPLDVYDVVIHLLPHQLPLCHLGVDFKPDGPARRKKRTEILKMVPVTGYNPVDCFLHDLRETYGQFAFFFYDGYGGQSIGVLWQPAAFCPVEFKVSQVNARMMKGPLTGSRPHLTPNVEAILEDFRLLGTGLVKNVEARSTQWVID